MKTPEEFEQLVEQAKNKVIQHYEGQPTTERKWLRADLDSYESGLYRISLFVLQGSPPKGCVLGNRTAGKVLAISSQMKILKTFGG